MKLWPRHHLLTVLAVAVLVLAGCNHRALPEANPEQRASASNLPPAYPRTEIHDPRLAEMIRDLRAWGLAQRAGRKQEHLYSRVEILPPTPTVQPYGVGAFEQEVRLPVIFTTGPGWGSLAMREREERVAAAFRHIAGHLEKLPGKPPLQPTLTVQTPQGLELAWINRLDASGKNLHGDEQ